MYYNIILLICFQINRRFSKKSSDFQEFNSIDNRNRRRHLLATYKRRQEEMAEDLLEIDPENDIESMEMKNENRQNEITMKNGGKYSTGIFPQVTRV